MKDIYVMIDSLDFEDVSSIKRRLKVVCIGVLFFVVDCNKHSDRIACISDWYPCSWYSIGF